MDYMNYKKSRNLAWEILSSEGVTELPVMVGKICTQMGIKVLYFDAPEGESDGYCLVSSGQPRIYVARDRPRERQRFTAAHELGHILLGHAGKFDLVNREPSETDNPIEHDANVFASRLLAPACVLWALDAHTPDEIADLCQISHQAATFRAQRMELLYQRGKFLTSPLERAVYQQFMPYIQRIKAQRQ